MSISLEGRVLSLVLFAIGAASFCNANTIYAVELTVGPASAIGDVVTDGTVGTLSAGDILDWNITVSDAANTVALTGPMSGNNSFFDISGSFFSATANKLQFNFGPPALRYWAFFQSNGSPISYLCFTSDSTTCSAGTPAQLGIQVDSANYGETFTGVQTVATAGAPEPGSGLLLAVGLAGLWSRTRWRST